MIAAASLGRVRAARELRQRFGYLTGCFGHDGLAHALSVAAAGSSGRALGRDVELGCGVARRPRRVVRTVLLVQRRDEFELLKDIATDGLRASTALVEADVEPSRNVVRATMSMWSLPSLGRPGWTRITTRRRGRPGR